MTQRGGYRGGVKPRLPERVKRTSLSCRVAPETKAWLLVMRDASYKSLGEWIDLAVCNLQTHPEAYTRHLMDYGT